MSVLIAFLGFNVLVLVHELGHYLVARWSGMRVQVFSIGFGPAVIRFKGAETVYQIAAIPLGGYVKVVGLNDQDRSPGSYLTRPLWQRALMVSAGPLANFAFAAVLYAYLFGSFNALSYGWNRSPTTVVRQVQGAAAEAGLLPFDVIEQINGQPVVHFDQLRKATGESGGAPMTLLVARSPDGQPPPYERRDAGKYVPGLVIAVPQAPADWPRVEVTITPTETKDGLLLGVAPDFARYGAVDWWAATRIAAAETWAIADLTLRQVGKLLQGDEKTQVVSVVKITAVGADRVKMGSEWFLALLAIISINLGLLNLLPIPLLDGGRLMFLGIEAISRKPVPRPLELTVNAVTFVLLMGFAVFVVGRDVVNLF